MEKGRSAKLNCTYDTEGDPLYAVKWYKGGREFYRYAPNETPVVKTFPIGNLTVKVSIESLFNPLLLLTSSPNLFPVLFHPPLDPLPKILVDPMGCSEGEIFTSKNDRQAGVAATKKRRQGCGKSNVLGFIAAGKLDGTITERSKVWRRRYLAPSRPSVSLNVPPHPREAWRIRDP